MCALCNGYTSLLGIRWPNGKVTVTSDEGYHPLETEQVVSVQFPLYGECENHCKDMSHQTVIMGYIF
jgi:hypothetical protein